MPGGSDACGGCLPTAAATGWITNAWVPALEVSQQIVPALLGMLHEADVPGYAAPAHLAGRRLRDGTARPESYQLWVGASAYGEAETVLITVMPYLTREAARHGDSAWC